MGPRKLGLWRQAIRTVQFVYSSEAGPVPKLLAIGTLLYLLSPVDFLPGVPPLSWLDDAFVAWFAYQFLEYLMRSHQAAPENNATETLDTTARVRDDEDQ